MSQKLTNFDRTPSAIEPASEPPCWEAFAVVARRRHTHTASLIVAAGLAALVIAGAALAGEFHSNPWLLSWIPATCCVTNDCCWEITERELKPLPGDQWEVVSTGQVRPRTAWSPDGKFYRCACDYDSESRHWIRHQGANTRCLFIPMRMTKR
jgi:hypothetical protein